VRVGLVKADVVEEMVLLTRRRDVGRARHRSTGCTSCAACRRRRDARSAGRGGRGTARERAARARTCAAAVASAAATGAAGATGHGGGGRGGRSGHCCGCGLRLGLARGCGPRRASRCRSTQCLVELRGGRVIGRGALFDDTGAGIEEEGRFVADAVHVRAAEAGRVRERAEYMKRGTAYTALQPAAATACLAQVSAQGGSVVAG
jgi:hypothetical protein